MTVGDSTKRFLNDLPTWAQVALVVGVVGLISLLYPTGARLDYNYEQGRPWLYDDLVAAFDFAVEKTERELAEERAARLVRAEPYLVFDQSAESRVLEEFSQVFSTRLLGLQEAAGSTDLVERPDRYRRVSEEFLREAYERGIAERLVADDEASPGVVRVVRGGEIDVLTPEQLTYLDEVLTDVEPQLRGAGLTDASVVASLMREVVQPNLLYSDSLTTAFAENEARQIPTTDAVVERGELIVAADVVVTGETVRKLDSYRRAYRRQELSERRTLVVRLGYLLLSGLALGTLVLYIRIFHPGEFRRFNRLMFILTLVLLVCFAVSRIDALTQVDVLVFPFAAVPIIVRAFYPPGVALFTHMVVVLIATFLTGLGYDFAFIQLIGGIVAVLSPAGLRDWSKIWRSLIVIAGAYVVGYIGLEFVNQGRLGDIDLAGLSRLTVGIFLTLLAYPLVPLLGRVFGFTSEVDLLDLTDVSRPALQRLSAVAPGTMQHSLAVANLAEAAAREIGADALLLRAGALYHDLGKAVHPEFFIENQVGRNPHERLDPAESAAHIIAHVEHGLRLGREVGLPSTFLDFIATHHGTTRTEYFYRDALGEREEGEVDEAAFRYPGPKPTSREQGILMLADSVEAASRSLSSPDVEQLDKLVEKIFAGKLRDGQLDDCELTLGEVTRIRRVLTENLRGSYHARVIYPESSASAEEEPVEPVRGAAS